MNLLQLACVVDLFARHMALTVTSWLHGICLLYALSKARNFLSSFSRIVGMVSQLPCVK